jgi:hypothetical protein
MGPAASPSRARNRPAYFSSSGLSLSHFKIVSRWYDVSLGAGEGGISSAVPAYVTRKVSNLLCIAS